jgi:hypothetical protein
MRIAAQREGELGRERSREILEYARYFSYPMPRARSMF